MKALLVFNIRIEMFKLIKQKCHNILFNIELEMCFLLKRDCHFPSSQKVITFSTYFAAELFYFLTGSDTALGTPELSSYFKYDAILFIDRLHDMSL